MPSPIKFFRLFRRVMSAPSRKVAVYSAVSWYWKSLGVVVFLATILGFGWISFDLGRKTAGYHSNLAKTKELKLREGVANLDEINLQLSRRVVNLEGKLKMALAVQENVSTEMRILSNENNRLKEEVVFFETLMTSGKEPGGVSVARFEVNQLTKAGEFEYRILVVQSQQRVKEFNGFFELITYFENSSGDNNDIVLSSDTKKNELKFKFYQRSVGKFVLPEGGRLVNVEARVFKNGLGTPVDTRTLEFGEEVD